MDDCFWKNGVGFTCSQCSACCRYESGFVFLYEKDIPPLLAALQVDFTEFVHRYCRWVDLHDGYEYLSLTETSSYDCILWNNGCSIYEARPLQCKAFPFWVSALQSLDAWLATIAGCNACIQLYTEPAPIVSERNTADDGIYPASPPQEQRADNAPPRELPPGFPQAAVFFSPARIAEIRNEQLNSVKVKRLKRKTFFS